jgi:hypothetical protein
MADGPREVEQRLRRAAVDLGRIAEHLDELATAESSALMGLTGALWYQEARLGLLTSVAKLTATAEVVRATMAAQKASEPTLVIPSPRLPRDLGR